MEFFASLGSSTFPNVLFQGVVKMSFGIRMVDSFPTCLFFLVSGSACINGDVRLMDEREPGTGRVELCLGGVWYSICGDSYWSNQDAQTVCRQLGYEQPESKELIECLK